MDGYPVTLNDLLHLTDHDRAVVEVEMYHRKLPHSDASLVELAFFLRVITVDKNPAYPKAIEELKRTRELGQRCRCRPIRYLNNVVEQDHRAIKRRVRAMQGFRSFHSAWRTIQGVETVNMMRKGQIRWLPKNDILGQAAFIVGLFGLAIAA